MKKERASVVILFGKFEADFWLKLFAHTQHEVYDVGQDRIVVTLFVKNYVMNDHQFIQIVTTIKGRAEALVWVPRNNLMAIIEGVQDLSEAFSFAAAVKTK